MAGLCVFALLTFAASAASGQTFKVLFDFDGTNGAFPWSGVVQGLDGNLYGTTTSSGFSSGTVYKITPAGVLTTVYEFCSLANCADGAYPEAELVVGTDGNFYGTTSADGATSSCNYCGTIFKLTPQGKLTTLHDFCSLSGCTDGSSGNYALVEGANGNFYGVTSMGGANNDGTIFEITPGGTFTTLYSFCAVTGCTDGSVPNAPLALGSNGALYGTTEEGGANNDGVVFEIANGVFTVLHSFDDTDGAGGQFGGRLVQGSNGDFYGETQFGGTTVCFVYGCGTIYKMTPSGTLTTLVDFTGTNGSNPVDGLVLGSDGNFYGTGGSGGTNDGGTIFKMTPSGALTTLYDFSCAGCSSFSPTGVFQSTNGTFYGTSGGGDGVIFTLAAGLKRFVVALPTSGKAGAEIRILGNGFTGATAVTFNGTVAAFTVASATEITATVPTGATSGKVSVTLSTGTVVSTDVSFRIP